ncbi:hypothetical protein MNBD_BACTEROID05-713 [hydrothermal vent metagenome]|uniref:Response regulatory domain-containing protein n=1 Tax=hydrothermal vent metagenome TaxID=652676 RepID=A0A3B0TZN3_9ZZZZ
MKSKISEIKVIAWSLSALYAVSFLVYLQLHQVFEFKMRALILLILFGVLFIASLGVLRKQEWGRVLLVVVNAVMGIYLLKPYVSFENVVPISYVFMNLIVLLFFNQKKVKNYFLPKEIEDWRSVLIIDDDEISIKILRNILLNHGYSVLTAMTGEEGLSIAIAQKPSLILLDVIMPGMKGREVCERLKKDLRTRPIPVVFITVKDSMDDIKAEKSLGAAAHLTKPIGSSQLMECVENILNPPKKEKGDWQSVLIVDDDEILIKTVRPLLMNNGYSVLTALTGEVALDIIKNQKPDLVILDVLLPGIKGRDVCLKIREDEETKNIPVIFLTAKESDDDIEAEMSAGAQAHLTKPVKPKKLLSTIRNILSPQPFEAK